MMAKENNKKGEENEKFFTFFTSIFDNNSNIITFF